MKHLIRLRPSPAMVVACLALGLALGGTSYAAIKLPKNSVGAKQLKKNAVTGPKIKSNAVTGADVKESSLAKVPTAVAADTAALATTATTATRHDGHTAATRTLSVETPSGGSPAAVTNGGAAQTVLNLNGLIITLTCPAVPSTCGPTTTPERRLSSGSTDTEQAAGAFSGGFRTSGPLPMPISDQGQQQRIRRGPLYSAQRDRSHCALRLAQRRFRGAGVACRVFGYAVSG